MLTLAMDSALFLSYDLSRGTLYKAWKGGVTLEGTVYTDKKNVQPTSWGKAYLEDSLQESNWEVHKGGQKVPSRFVHRGYRILEDRVTIMHALVLDSNDTVFLEERPEFIRDAQGKPGLERTFSTSQVPPGIFVQLVLPDSTMELKPNGTTHATRYFNYIPPQSPPDIQEEYDHLGRYWMETSDCFTCHEMERDNVGPSFKNIALRYSNDKETIRLLVQKVKEGGTGTWGSAVMNPHPGLADKEIQTMMGYIFSLQPVGEKGGSKKITGISPVPEKPQPKPGFGASLEGVHPSYELQTIHNQSFKPRVGGLAFLPDGRLVVSTWDSVGGIYLLDGVETGDTSRINVKRIASGLAEPLGLEVVDGEIYVLQKHELTRLIDLDGDDVVDEYQSICNSWGVTGDFHEFAFGLVYKEGYFYVTLSMAMRLMEGQRQHPDRGRTIKISKNGQFEWLNYGLRTPNGIGLGPEGELFVTDNQGQWLPGNKLIHVQKGEYLGMAWGLPDSVSTPPPPVPPAIWLPDGEIGNSPSEPILMQDGPYMGQMLHGDVTHGGIKRDFLEKINGKYQGAVFRFSQGFEAGVNRLVWGPDGALYVGGVGMVGGWSWKEKKSGLQRMKYTGQPTFEMLAIRAKPRGFEIELTEPLEEGEPLSGHDITVQQWWYQPTENYGGPKMDLTQLQVIALEVSEDRKRLLLSIPGLKKEHVVYFRLPEDLRSGTGQSLWSSEAWYTLNNIPD
jgi:cytochrome c